MYGIHTQGLADWQEDRCEDKTGRRHVHKCTDNQQEDIEDGFIAGGEEAGIFAAGCARMPLDVTRSAQSGTAAALKAVQTVKGR